MTHFSPTDHWQSVYASKAPEAVSWFRPHLELSLQLLERAGLNVTSRVIDIGAGAATLIDDLLARGVGNLIALDLCESALRIARERLGERARQVTWVVGDVTSIDLPSGSIDLWHDRAALHFLTDDRAVQAYVRAASGALAPGGHAVIACFAPDGPSRCSGLPVVRRDVTELAHLFIEHFDLVEGRRESHATPSGQRQSFAYALLRRRIG